MTDPFIAALHHVLDREGGLSELPADKGGLTKFGITLKTLAEFRAPLQVSPQDLRNLSQQEAGHIYRDLYWDRMNLDLIRDKKTALILFDYGVHAGCATAVKLFQSCLNQNFLERIAVDGVLGPETVSAFCRVNRTKLNRKIIQGIQTHYCSICRHDPSQLVFLEGWLNRTFALQDQRDGYGFFSFF